MTGFVELFCDDLKSFWKLKVDSSSTTPCSTYLETTTPTRNTANMSSPQRRPHTQDTTTFGRLNLNIIEHITALYTFKAVKGFH